MTNVVLITVPEPEPGTAAVLTQAGSKEPPFAYFTGGGDVNYLCGGCSFELAHGMDDGQISQFVIQCPRCEAFNRTRV